MADVKGSIEQAVAYLTEHPDEARYTDSVATAKLGDSLRVEVEGPAGERIVTDMTGGVGGQGEHPSPGWLPFTLEYQERTRSVRIKVQWDKPTGRHRSLGRDAR